MRYAFQLGQDLISTEHGEPGESVFFFGKLPTMGEQPIDVCVSQSWWKMFLVKIKNILIRIRKKVCKVHLEKWW